MFLDYQRRKHNAQEGFTLIELLLGLAIFSIIALSAYSIFSTGIELNRRSELSNRSYRDIRWAVDLISRELENAITYDFSESYPEKRAFEGDLERILFFSETDKGIAVVEYSLVSANEGTILQTLIGNTQSGNQDITVNEQIDSGTYYLVRSQGTFLDFIGERFNENAEREIICGNIIRDGLKFSFGHLKGSESNEVVWIDSWEFSYIPSNVRLEMKVAVDKKSEQILEIRKNILIPSGFLGVEQ